MSRFFLLALATLGCKKPIEPSPDDSDPVVVDPLTTAAPVTVASDGKASILIDIPEGTRSFFITATADQHVMVEKLYNPSGDRVTRWQDWMNGESLSIALLPYFEDQVTFNWPVRAIDGPLTPGEWEVVLSTYDNEGQFTDGEIEYTLQTMKDDDMSKGTVPVRIVYAEGLDEDEDLVAAIEAGVEHWRALWADIGLTLEESYDTSSIDPDGGHPGQGNSGNYEEIAAEGTDRDLTLVVVDYIGGMHNLYGESGGIPGSPLALENSVVALSWLAHSGANGNFDDGEIGLMGETMAHEIGHYIGLFHPAEFDGETAFAWDALEDTAKCPDYYECIETLDTNLMFAYPVCNFNGSNCTPQTEITAEQQGVVQQYISVD